MPLMQITSQVLQHFCSHACMHDLLEKLSSLWEHFVLLELLEKLPETLLVTRTSFRPHATPVQGLMAP